MAPWFSGGLVNLAKNIRSSGDGGSPFPVTNATTLDLYDKGYWSSPNDFLTSNKDPIGYAVKYCLQDSSPQGRRLIVRWNSWINLFYNVPSSAGIIKSKTIFEVVLYENGRIEFRYGPRRDFEVYSSYVRVLTALGYTEPAASVGIFKRSSTRTWEFRDFSPGLGYRDSERDNYTLGGSVYDPTYTDTNVLIKPYSVNLVLSKHWPGDNLSGGTFTFQPPMLKRRVLPRLLIKEIDSKITMPTVARTGDSRMGNHNIFFDDRRSIAYKQGIVNYPTTLPRFYGNTAEGVSGRQNLFSGDFLVTGSVISSNVQQFIGNENQSYSSPFEDHNRPENDPGADEDVFFSVGTSVNDVGMGFKQPLKAKTQIKLKFSVDEKTKFPGNRSVIYYYNKKNRRWQYPIKAVDQDVLSNEELPSADMDVGSSFFFEHRIVETDRGFNAYGIPICSGSSADAERIPPSIEYNGTDGIFNSLWTSINESSALNKGYGNSFQTNARYSPTEDEAFTLPINHPFLIEKAVIEFPLEAGPTWFADKTQCFLPINPRNPNDIPYGTYATNSLGEDVGYSNSYRSNGFHVGGPGLTFALYNNVRTGISSDRRELILSGTVTHCHDDDTEIKLYDYELDTNYVWQVVPRGFNAYGTPSALVCPNEEKMLSITVGSGRSASVVNVLGEFFTGSVSLKCQAAISNGPIVRDTIFGNYEGKFAEYGLPAVIDYAFDTPTWKKDPAIGPLGSEPLTFSEEDPPSSGISKVYGFREKTIVGVDNLGRGGTGFDQSARSIFGKDFSTETTKFYENPFYLYDVNNVKDSLDYYLSFPLPIPKIFFTQVVPTVKTKVSPYLVFPGDKLSLTVSKSRPFCYSGDLSSGSIPFDPLMHDIKLNTGSINITLYGSLVSNGREFHDTLNQPLASDAIHETFIGGTKTW